MVSFEEDATRSRSRGRCRTCGCRIRRTSPVDWLCATGIVAERVRLNLNRAGMSPWLMFGSMSWFAELLAWLLRRSKCLVLGFLGDASVGRWSAQLSVYGEEEECLGAMEYTHCTGTCFRHSAVERGYLAHLLGSHVISARSLYSLC